MSSTKLNFDAPDLSSTNSSLQSHSRNIFAGLEDVQISKFTRISDLQELVNAQTHKLFNDITNQQYLIFHSVTQANLEEFEKTQPRYARICYYADINLLIVKIMPSLEQESSHVSFGRKLDAKLNKMGIPDNALTFLGGTRYSGITSAKEGDSAFKPSCRRKKTDWPTLVIESGLPESLLRLRYDARWWLTNSEG